MKNNIFLSIVTFILLLSSCYKDETVVDTRVISNIEIDLPIDDFSVVELEKNDQYILDPNIKVSNGTDELKYEWEINQVIVSREKKYVYEAKSLGLYDVRLKVSNEDGSTFKRFKINVNSPYEEGLIVLSEKIDGEGSFSFIRRYPNQMLSQTPLATIHTNVFEINNPEFNFGIKPTDVGQTPGMIYIASEEGHVWGLDPKTFEVETKISENNLPDFKPVRMLIPNNTSRNAIAISRSGQIYDLATFENFVFAAPALLKNVVVDSKAQLVLGGWLNNYFFWDANNSRFMSYNGYYLDTTEDYFNGKDLVNFCVNANTIYLILKDKVNPAVLTKTVLTDEFINYGTYSSAITKVLEAKSTTLSKDAPSVLVDKYVKYMYAYGNSVYQWFYTTDNLPETPLFTINIPGVITALEKDPESNELYVAVYNSAASSSKGSVLVYDIQTGALKASFLGISEKPVKLFYKTKV